MADEINTLTAGKLRNAFKRTVDKDIAPDAVPEVYQGDRVEVRSTYYTTGRRDLILAVLKEGEVVALAPFDKKTIKRLRAEINHWNDTQSGFRQAYSAHRGFRDMRKDG